MVQIGRMSGISRRIPRRRGGRHRQPGVSLHQPGSVRGVRVLRSRLGSIAHRLRTAAPIALTAATVLTAATGASAVTARPHAPAPTPGPGPPPPAAAPHQLTLPAPPTPAGAAP